MPSLPSEGDSPNHNKLSIWIIDCIGFAFPFANPLTGRRPVALAEEAYSVVDVYPGIPLSSGGPSKISRKLNHLACI